MWPQNETELAGPEHAKSPEVTSIGNLGTKSENARGISKGLLAKNRDIIH